MSRCDFYDVVELASERGGDDEFFPPSRQGHGLLKNTVGVVASIGYHSEVVAVEHGNLLAVASGHSGSAEVAAP